jgi:uncharacterized protein (DUF39 family)
MRLFHDILQRIEQREAVVLTSQEVCEMVRSGQKETLLEVDVVTAATRAVMSGTYAVLSFPVAEPGRFRRAISARLNGIPAFVGHAPTRTWELWTSLFMEQCID